jgi:hypothetical protein
VRRRIVATLIVAVLMAAAPAFAQRQAAAPPAGVEFRPFAIFAIEWFSAATTFNATLDSSFQPLWGGGVEITTRKNVFVDVTVSRLSRNGHRAFVDDAGQAFPLTVPMHASLTPIEFTVGRRFPPGRRRAGRRRLTLIPYVGVGAGMYRYDETSEGSSAGDDVAVTHAGFLAVGGAEFRVSKWVGITADAQYTRVPGILGQGGVSRQAGEHDLGGIAGRVRVILGR